MYLAFVDDSGQQTVRRAGLGSLVAAGAVVMSEESVAPIRNSIVTIRREFQLPETEEMKWKPAKGSTQAALSGIQITELRRRILQIAIENKARSVVTVLDHSKAHKTKTSVEVSRELLEWIYDRISRILQECDERGMIFADKPGGGHKDEARWLRGTLELTNGGTSYTRPERIDMPIVTAASDHLPMLQLADLVTAATTAAVAGHTSGLKLADLLGQLAHKNGYDCAAGAGIKLWPPANQQSV